MDYTLWPLLFTADYLVTNLNAQVVQKWSDRRTRKKALRRHENISPHNFTCEIGPRRRPKGEAAGRSHKAAFEDDGEMAVFSCAETSFSTTC
jgi:hypothetical protein